MYAFLIKADGSYILIDTGAPTDDSAELLLKNLDTIMGGGKLKFIILTHGMRVAPGLDTEAQEDLLALAAFLHHRA